MPRKIKGSWLDAFMEWTLPRSEAPATMIKWSGLFCLAAVAKRKVVFPRSLLGSYDIQPNLYIVFIAEPGIARKSTTAGYAQVLLYDMSNSMGMGGEKITFAPDVTSYSKILGALSDSPDASLTIIASEFASLVQTTPEQTYQILTDIFDNRPNLAWDTWAHGSHKIEAPVINLLGAAVPDWLANQPPEYIIGGGLGSRILFVHETRRRQDKLYYTDVDQNHIKRLGDDLLNDLQHIATLKGEFSHDSKSTEKYCEAWYQKHVKKENNDKRLKGFAERKHVHAHKIAMILSLAERDDLKITRKLWDKAIEYLDELEKRLPRALSSMGKNPLGREMDSILEFIEFHGPSSLETIAARFYRDLLPEQLSSTLAYLIVAGKLKGRGEAKNPIYELK